MSQPTEAQILTRYLLPPSNLPTILPFPTFISLLPPAHRANPAARKLYTELQFQRTIDLDIVRDNIDRECSRSHILKGRLRRDLRDELLGAEGAVGTNPRTTTRDKRRTSYNDDTDDDDGDEHDENAMEIDESDHAGTPNPNPTNNNAHDPLDNPRERLLDQAFHGHPGATLPIPHSRYHTPASLLQTMHATVADLHAEIRDLDAQAEQVLKQMQDTVGGLSDLRYGRFARATSGGADVEGEVVAALRQIQGIARRR